MPLPPDVEPLSKSGVVRGTAIAAASGGAIVAEALPVLVSELERADLAALRRSGERTGRLQEQLEQEREVSDARQRMLDASRDRPRGADDLARRMRDGEF